MGDFISRDTALMNCADNQYAAADKDEQEYKFWDRVYEFIQSLPAADARSVVYCKDCIHCQKDTIFNEMWCNGERVFAEHFCGDGERKVNSNAAIH